MYRLVLGLFLMAYFLVQAALSLYYGDGHMALLYSTVGGAADYSTRQDAT